MSKPDRVLRLRPLSEVHEALEKLQRVVLFHPHEIVKELPAEMCLCEKGELVDGKKSAMMTQCDERLEWYHNDCVAIPDDVDPQ